jgi:leucyl-tRNA synthetase family protein
MAVPAHDERDFEFAKKYELPTKEVIAKVYEQTGENASRNDVETLECKVVVAIVENTNNEVLLIHESSHGVTNFTFIGGGMEQGEVELDALKREIIEESGYTDFDIVSKIPVGIFVKGYRHPKGKNQNSFGYAYHVKLRSDNKVKSEAEEGKHALRWVKKDEVKNILTWAHHLYVWQVLLGELKIFTDNGVLINSKDFDNFTSEEAKKKITEFVGGKTVSTYRLRDWGVSRQRYWGCPIPIVYDPEGKAHPVPDEHLPWILPTDVDHTPDGTAPLARSKELFECTERLFGKGWKPEVETMDTFVDSSWYFYRYLDNKNDTAFADAKKMDAWMPIDLYMGGAEYTTMHLLYSRFWTKALYDLGFVKDVEAYKVRRNRGLILGPDGNKMSKSKGNVINPDEIVDRLGADTVRMYLAFMGPYGITANYPWDPNGVVGVRRFLERVWKSKEKIGDVQENKIIHKIIKKITEDIEEHKYNTAISAMMILLNEWDKQESISKQDYKTLLQLLAPFAPHITEELWHQLGERESIHLSVWPKYDESLVIEDQVTVGVQINGKLRAEITLAKDMDTKEVEKMVLELSKIKEYTEGKSINKIIIVPNRIINIVISS